MARIASVERQGVAADTWPCSNPIGSIDKSDLKRFIAWAEVNFDLPCLHDFLTAIPTAEVRSFDHCDRIDLLIFRQLEPITET